MVSQTRFPARKSARNYTWLGKERHPSPIAASKGGERGWGGGVGGWGEGNKDGEEGGRGGASAFETPCDQMQNPSASETIAAAAAAPLGGGRGERPGGAVCLAWWPARRSPARRVGGSGSASRLLSTRDFAGWQQTLRQKKKKKQKGKYGESAGPPTGRN